jgi:hypothetical protein
VRRKNYAEQRSNTKNSLRFMGAGRLTSKRKPRLWNSKTRRRKPAVDTVRKTYGLPFDAPGFWTTPRFKLKEGNSMRRKNSYIKKYGKDAGTIIFKLLQKEAAHARWKDEYRKKLKALKSRVT